MGFGYRRWTKTLPGTREWLLVGAAYLCVSVLCLFLAGFCIEVTGQFLIGFLMVVTVMAMVAAIGFVAALLFEHRSMNKKVD
jgi:hypothetical protein